MRLTRRKKPERSRKGPVWDCKMPPEKHWSNAATACLGLHSWPSNDNLSVLHDRWRQAEHLGMTEASKDLHGWEGPVCVVTKGEPSRVGLSTFGSDRS
jgi:hypothetical protein